MVPYHKHKEEASCKLIILLGFLKELLIVLSCNLCIYFYNLLRLHYIPQDKLTIGIFLLGFGDNLLIVSFWTVLIFILFFFFNYLKLEKISQNWTWTAHLSISNQNVSFSPMKCKPRKIERGNIFLCLKTWLAW